MKVVIVDNHTHVVLIEKDGDTLFEKESTSTLGETDKTAFLQTLSLKDILDLPKAYPLKISDLSGKQSC